MAKNENTKISTLDDEPQDPSLASAQESTSIVGDNHDEEMSGDRVDVTIYEQEGDAGREAVFIGVNGTGYQIPRGKPFSIPIEVLHVLDNSVQTIYESMPNGETRQRTLKRFNYTNHGPSRA